jgi:hypothetical protein
MKKISIALTALLMFSLKVSYSSEVLCEPLRLVVKVIEITPPKVKVVSETFRGKALDLTFPISAHKGDLLECVFCQGKITKCSQRKAINIINWR